MEITNALTQKYLYINQGIGNELNTINEKEKLNMTNYLFGAGIKFPLQNNFSIFIEYYYSVIDDYEF